MKKLLIVFIYFICSYHNLGYCASNETQSVTVIQKNGKFVEEFINSARGNNEELRLINEGIDINIQDKNGRTALMEAASRGNYKIVKLLIDRGAKINLKSNLGETAIHLSVKLYPCFPLVKLLVEKGAAVNATDNAGSTPLMVLCENHDRHQQQILKYLLCNGANADIVNKNNQTALSIAAGAGKTSFISILNEKSKYKNHVWRKNENVYANNSLSSQFVEAIEKNDIKGIEALIKSGADVDSLDNNGNTPLYYAVKKNNFKIAGLLIDNWADVNCYSYDSRAILGAAVYNQNIKLSKLLIDNGAYASYDHIYYAIKSSNEDLIKLFSDNCPEFDIISIKNKCDWDYLFTVVENNDSEFLKALIDIGADVDYLNIDKLPLLSFVCKLGFYETAKVLVERGADIKIADNYGINPIIWASWYGHTEIVKLLIDKGANVNSKTIDGTSALMFAAMAGNIEVMKLLIDRGANIEDKNNNEINAVIEAMTSNQTEAVSLLKMKGADIASAEEGLKLIINSGTNVNVKDKFRASLLIVAAYDNNMKTVKLLIDRGADVSYQIHGDKSRYDPANNFDGITALYCAARNNNEAMIKLLIDKGALRDNIDENKFPILIMAFQRHPKNYSLIKYLIDKKFNVNEYFKDKNYSCAGTTPLIESFGNVNITKLLIKNGADVNQVVNGDFIGERTPLMIAVKKLDHSSFDLLVKNNADINYKIMENYIVCESGHILSGFDSINNAIGVLTDPKNYSTKFTFNRGRSVLHEAAEAGDIEIIKKLQKMGIDIREKNEFGWTCLMLSLRSNKLELVKYFVDNDNDINAVSSEGFKWTAILEAATVCKNIDIIDYLIKKGADVNQRSVKRWTPLMFAVRSDNVEIAEMLIKNGANVNAVNNNSMSALDIATQANYVNSEIVRLLKKSGAE